MTDIAPSETAPAAEAPKAAEAITGEHGAYARPALSHDKMTLLATRLNADVDWKLDTEKGAWVGTSPHGTYTLTKDKSSTDPAKHALVLNFVSADGARDSTVRLTDQDSEYAAKKNATFKMVDNLNQTARDHPLLDDAYTTPSGTEPPAGEEDKL